jgi:hypothetical protein
MNQKLRLELNFLFTAFIINFFYEVVQSNVYIFYGINFLVDDALVKTVSFIALKILLDLFILLVNFNILARARKNIFWFSKPKISDITLFTLLGVVYAQYNEVINVYFLHTWGYRSILPLMPVFRIGIPPFIQWAVLAPLVLFVFRNWYHADPSDEHKT